LRFLELCCQTSYNATPQHSSAHDDVPIAEAGDEKISAVDGQIADRCHSITGDQLTGQQRLTLKRPTITTIGVEPQRADTSAREIIPAQQSQIIH